MDNIGIIILAAGASTRLGQPKQLLVYEGKTLIQKITEVAINTGCQPVVVVLGAYAAKIEPQLNHFRVHIAFNEQWSTGMGSSLQCGLREMQAIAPNLDATIVMVCDQPFVSTDLLQQLVRGYQTSSCAIVASEYNGIVGVPALFDRTLFSELTTIAGDVGARRMIRHYQSRVLKIPFAEGAIDLDTPEDLKSQ